MQLRYLPEARKDIAWWRIYYRKAFPQGGGNAYRHLAASERLLKDNPQLGVRIEHRDLRKLAIPQTPFAIIYRIKANAIEVVRLYDMRQQGSDSFQED